MGASLDEIVADYMKSYENYYGVKPGDDKYDLIAEGNVKEMLRAMAGLEKGADLAGVDLQKAAETYLTPSSARPWPPASTATWGPTSPAWPWPPPALRWATS